VSDEQEKIGNRIEEWLRQQGYPLEMRVADAFHQAGFHVFQGHSYEDPATKTPREIDVQATHGLEFKVARGKKIALTFEFSVECKSTSDKPWVAFAAKPSFLDGFLKLEFAASFETLLFSMAVSDVMKSDLPLPPFGDAPRVFGVAVALRKASEHDLAFNAIMAAASAASHERAESLQANHRESAKKGWLFFKIPIAAVVTNQPLFLASLAPDPSVGSLQVMPASIVIAKAALANRSQPVLVLTEPELANFLKRALNSLERFREQFEALDPSKRLRIWNKFLDGLPLPPDKV
jgi:hypothetical protein